MSRSSSLLRTLVLIAIAGAVVSCGGGEDPDRRRVGIDAFIDASNGATAVCGSLTIGVITDEAGISIAADSSDPVFHTRFVVDDFYGGMEDNDLRGYLDGAFKEGWNQVSQSHLRLGRRGRNPAFGEFELFRNLHRWSDLGMPGNISVESAALELVLESGPPFPVDVAVYAVKKDWNPGKGGTNEDNNSPPAPGEVWWLEAQAGELQWGRPGVGFAADNDPDADTGAQPLAVARYTPGNQPVLVFRSNRLARYTEEQLQAGLPLLLLYKLTDPYEDSVGSVMEIWSANFGTHGSARRPSLHIDWRPASADTYRFDIALEPGRLLNLGRIETDGAQALVSRFTADEIQTSCAGEHRVEFRIENESAWIPLTRVAGIDAPSVEIRVAAVSRPVPLGGSSKSQLRDTWVADGQPEDHEVRWTFAAPDGRTLDSLGEYVGDFTWQATLPADIIGRWTYRWTHALSGKQVTSETVVYDVVAWEPELVLQGLKSLAEDIRRSGAQPRSHDMTQYELAFMRLERAAMALPPRSVAGQDAASKIEQDLHELRVLLSGKPVPEEFEAAPIRSRTQK